MDKKTFEKIKKHMGNGFPFLALINGKFHTYFLNSNDAGSIMGEAITFMEREGILKNNMDKATLALFSSEEIGVILIALKDHQFNFQHNQFTADKLVEYFERGAETDRLASCDLKTCNCKNGHNG